MTNAKKQKATLISFGFDAVLLELNKARCCLARVCALVHSLFAWSCMVSFAKVFQFLVLRCDWEINCAMLSLIVNPLLFSFWISDTSCGNECSALHIVVTQALLGAVLQMLLFNCKARHSITHLAYGKYFVFQREA